MQLKTQPAFSFARRTPVLYRNLALLFVLSASFTARSERLTEADVVRLAKTRDAEVLTARASAARIEAEGERASLYPNPTIGWEREHLETGPDTTEDSIFVRVPLEFAGRRPTERALARADTASAKAQAARTQGESVKSALRAFYAALALEREKQIVSRTVARLQEAARVVGRRHEEGTTSGYERARLELEADLAQSQLRQTEAMARMSRVTLAALLGLDPTNLELSGDFETGGADAKIETPDRRSIQYWRSAESAAHDARDAARFGWVPALSLTGGIRIEDATVPRYGYVAGIELSLPIFSRGQALVLESAARMRLASAQTLLAQRETRIDTLRAREQLVSAKAELVRFTESTRARVEILERAAVAGYREGDRSIVELVDAERARADVERRILELELLAKRAELDLRASRGEFE